MMTSLFDLHGACSIITGGGQGLGKHMAFALAEAGSNILIADIVLSRAKETVKEIKSMGVETEAVEADVRSRRDIEGMVRTAVKRFKRIDVLVNNAGICKHVKAEDMAYQDWLEIMDVNLNGVFLVSQAVGRVMIRQKKGSIINISSMSGIIVNTPQNQAAYNISKAGVIMLTKSLAAEWAQHGIRVNAIAPGYMNIGVAERFFREKNEMVNRWLSLIPMERPGEPYELGGTVVYLASAASSYVTGAVLTVDGGYTVW